MTCDHKWTAGGTLIPVSLTLRTGILFVQIYSPKVTRNSWAPSCGILVALYPWPAPTLSPGKVEIIADVISGEKEHAENPDAVFLRYHNASTTS